MSPLELKLMRDFKKIQNEIEEQWSEAMGKAHDFADDICCKKFFEIQNIVDRFININNHNQYDEIFDEFIETFKSSVKYIRGIDDKNEFKMIGLKEDIILFCKLDNTKEKFEKIQKLQSIAYHNNLQKITNRMSLFTNQTIGRVSWLLNTIGNEVIDPYIDLILKEWDRVKEKVDKINEEMNDEEQQLSDDTSKNEIKKIFDYKKMNKLLELQGFKEVRQTGDHKIYNNGSKSIPVPQHDLGKGLSCKIQKQI